MPLWTRQQQKRKPGACCAAENDLDSGVYELQPAAAQAENLRPKRTNVWQDTFSPQMNSNMKKLPASYYDAPSTDKQATTVWEEIIKAETVKKGFEYFDADRARPQCCPLSNAQTPSLFPVCVLLQLVIECPCSIL